MLVRCSSEFPFFPGAYRLFQWARQQRFGRIIEVEAGFSHSSDLNPEKTVDWKRMVDVKGAYGCMEDLGQLAHGKDMQQPFHCGIPSEAASSHDRFTSALTSHSQQKALPLTP